jgi:hypothetical protein
MKDFVEQRLLAILKSPNGWGPPMAVELQVLLLVEMWHVIQGAPSEHVDRTSWRFAAYLGLVLPGPPVSLASRLELTDEASDQFVSILRAFVEHEQGSNPT